MSNIDDQPTISALDAEQFSTLQQLLRTHRRTLSHYLNQKAQQGSPYVAPGVLHGIEECRAEIHRIKCVLLNNGAAVDYFAYDRAEAIKQSTFPTPLPPDINGDLSPLPPEFTTYLLWYLPRAVRNDVMGDLQEEFTTIHKLFGKRKAVIWYYYQVGASFSPFAMSTIKKLIKWGLVGWVGEVVRRFIS